MLSLFERVFNFLLKLNYKPNKILLGRWCHINMDKCTSNVINKKIDFATLDNSFDYKIKK